MTWPCSDGQLYLSRGNVVFQWMDCEAKDVVIVSEVEPLAVLQTVVDHANSSHVIDHLPRLTVVQVVTAVKAAVPAGGRRQTWTLTLTSTNMKHHNSVLPVNKLKAKPLLRSFLSLQRPNQLLPKLWEVLLVDLGGKRAQ